MTAQREGEAPLLQASGLGWTVGGRPIIDSLSLSVERGELVGVIGPNGAGKTTLLRLLSGLLAPTAGTVRIDGRDINAMDARTRARTIAYMSAEPPREFPFTVMDILLMGRYPHLRRFEQPTEGDREKARRSLSYVGLQGFDMRLFGELSSGERQLVLFAKVLVQDTDLLALDEPSSSLDITHQDSIFSMAQELAREKRAVIASVHTLGVAAQYCSRLVLMEMGRIAAVGRPEEVLVERTLDRVYKTRTLVSPSMATGALSVTVIPRRRPGSGKRVHIIGGAGSAVNLTRHLYRLGFTVSGGIAHEHDSDEKLWASLGIEHESVGTFSRISESEVERAARLVRESEITILCSFPVGPGNIGNLRLASHARRLFVLETGAEDIPRSFLSAEGEELFRSLCRSARILTYTDMLGELEREERNSLLP